MSYEYAPSGLRLSKTVSDKTTDFVLDSGYVMLELQDGVVTGNYVRALNLVADTSGGSAVYYLYNGHSDVVQLTDSTGSVVRSYEYDAFGNELEPDEEDGNPFRYCAEYFDAETGRIYLRARYYDPVIGRFLSEDTYRGSYSDPLTLNLYTYCLNNPIRYIDTTGNAVEDVTRFLTHLVAVNPLTITATQEGWISDIFYAAGFFRDSKGVYHTRQDALQQYGGYNDFYDAVFYYGTSMDKAKFEFTSGDRRYILWAWKGDYLNLGAGAEIGIYSNQSQSGIAGLTDIESPYDKHWLVDTNLAMTMTLNLYYKGNHIISYYPSEKQWWITGFNPYYLHKQASDLTAVYTIKFNTQTMYNDFYNTYGQGKKSDNRWTFDPDAMTGTFTF